MVKVRDSGQVRVRKESLKYGVGILNGRHTVAGVDQSQDQTKGDEIRCAALSIGR